MNHLHSNYIPQVRQYTTGLLFLSICCFILLATTSCNATANNPAQPPQQADVLNAQYNHQSKVEVTITAPVIKLLPEDREGLAHQRFLILLSNGSTVLIAHDISYAPEVPIHQGDMITIHGEYIWNSKGGLIHWTHHSDSPRHEGGWIKFNEQIYQ